MDLSKVESLDGYSFYGSGISNANLVGFTDSRIGVRNFENTDSLTTVTFPNRTFEIASSAFKGASKLNTVTASSETNITNIGVSAFENCTSLNNASFLTNSSIKKVENYAFANCGTITSNGVLNLKAKQIESGVFSESKVKEVNYEGTGTFSGFSGIQTFKNCTSLEKVTCFNAKPTGFPVSPEDFRGCVNLKELSFLIPNTEANAEYINWHGRWPEWSKAENILKDCNKLEKVTFYGTVDAWLRSFYTDFTLGGERASFLTNLGSEILDLRKSNVQVICQGGCKETNETGSITLSKSNIISYLSKFKDF